MRTSYGSIFWVIVLTVVLAYSPPRVSAQDTVGTTKLWPTTAKTIEAFNTLTPKKGKPTKTDLQHVIDLTSEVIDEYRQQARDDQKQLEQDVKAHKVAAPGLKRISKEEFDRVADNGILNDTAACYYIRGKAHRALGEFTLAADDFRAGTQLTMARCWDPGPGNTGGWNNIGIFWSPAKACEYKLEDMLEKKQITKEQAKVSNDK